MDADHEPSFGEQADEQPLAAAVRECVGIRKNRWVVRKALTILLSMGVTSGTLNYAKARDPRIPAPDALWTLLAPAAVMAWAGMRGRRRRLHERLDRAIACDPGEVQRTLRTLAQEPGYGAENQQAITWVKTHVLGLHPDAEL